MAVAVGGALARAGDERGEEVGKRKKENKKKEEGEGEGEGEKREGKRGVVAAQFLFSIHQIINYFI